MKVKKRNKIILVITIPLLVVTIISFVMYNYVLYLPGLLCDYIEYNGEKYCPLAIYEDVSAGGIDTDKQVPVVLYNSDGNRIGIFRKHYAYMYCNDEDVEFLHFDSCEYTKNPNLW